MKKISLAILPFLVYSVCAQTPKTETDTFFNGPHYLSNLQFPDNYPTGATVTRLYDEIDFQRACQAYIWATPTVAINELWLANHITYGANFNDPVVVRSFVTPSIVALTGNSTSIYTTVFIDLSIDGPVVIESPAGAYGVIDDWWQRPVSEVGPLGPDKGKGGNFLVVPEGYKGEVPAGYMVVSSKTNKNLYLARALVRDNDVKPAVALLETIKVYPLSQRANPKPNNYPDTNKPINTIPPRGFEYWGRLSQIINSEPVEERDRFFMAMLKPLGIEKGKPFNPDERQKRILTEAAEFGFRMAQVISMAPRTEGVKMYPGTNWEYVLKLDPSQESEYYSQLDERTDYTFEAITIAKGMILKTIGAGSQYGSAAKDKDGNWLVGENNYKLTVPANPPVKDYWSVVVYDNMTRSMIDNGEQKVSVSSNDKLQVNADGTVDVYFGPTAPAGKESNWIKTVPGKGLFIYFRWYGPTEAFFDKTWKLTDVEKI